MLVCHVYSRVEQRRLSALKPLAQHVHTGFGLHPHCFEFPCLKQDTFAILKDSFSPSSRTTGVNALWNPCSYSSYGTLTTCSFRILSGGVSLENICDPGGAGRKVSPKLAEKPQDPKFQPRTHSHNTSFVVCSTEEHSRQGSMV